MAEEGHGPVIMRGKITGLALVLAVALGIAGCGESGGGKQAEQEFDRNLKYEVAEEHLEEEGFSGDEAAEAREFAEEEHLGAQGAVELGATAKGAGR